MSSHTLAASLVTAALPALEARFAAAGDIITEAGRLARVRFGEIETLSVDVKFNGQDVATSADREVEALIRARVAAAFPEDGFLGEEDGLAAGDAPYVWVVDPIDGTSCFLHGVTTWCVSVALCSGGTTLFGLIYDPNADELFAALAGRGVTLNGRAISVDSRYDISTGLVGVGGNHKVPGATIGGFITTLLDAGGMFMRNGSGALTLAHVSCGRLIAYQEQSINLWDCAAGLCLIREAGGWTSAFPEDPATTHRAPLLAGAPHVREPLEALLAASALSS